jgi:hypothetical protein
VAGANTIPLWYSDQKVSLSPFIGEYSPISDVPIASVATAWDNPDNGSMLILVINEALYFGDRMDYSLLCPNQLHWNGLVVNDVPPMFNPDKPQCISIPDKLEIPLKMRGVMSYIEMRKPTIDELAKCEHLELTSARPWNPNELGLDSRELGSFKAGCQDGKSNFLCQRRDPPELSISSLSRLISQDVHSSVAHDVADNVHEADVISHEMIHREASATGTSARSSVITKEILAKRWGIGLEVADRTLQATSQLGM